MVLEVTKYACPYCGEEYKDYDDAEYCAEKCVEPTNVDDPDEVEYYICEYCSEDYKKESLAEKCENKHIKDKDKYFRAVEEKLKREKLEKAANHPSQKKLV